MVFSCVLVMKYEKSGSFKSYVWLLLKKGIYDCLINTCCGFVGLIVNRFGTAFALDSTGSKMN